LIVQYLDQLVKGGAPLSPIAARQLIESFRKNPVSPLSFRETEVVRLLVKGNTYTQIASSLQISKETSKTHMKNIYKKLGVNSKSLALQRVMEDRLI
jgi:DNA-binding NarL/FixJ family response regulator